MLTWDKDVSRINILYTMEADVNKKYKVVKKDFYHMYALGEIVERISSAEIMGTFIYANERGIMQRLEHDQVVLMVDNDQKVL